MPELPEVETVRAWLDPAIRGGTLTEITLRREDLRYPIPVAAVKAQVGRRVTAVRRRAKYLLIDTVGDGTPDTSLLVHLGMSGRCWVGDSDEAPDWRKHEHWRMRVRRPGGADQLLRYQDARRFGALDVVERAEDHRLLSTLGPEPFDPSWTGARLYAETRGRRAAIKAFLMDARRVVGVGNIYASEACWRARVHPLKPAGRVGQAACLRLVDAVRDVLQEAIDAGGSTLRDFVGGDENPGYFQQRLDVYAREGQACHRCGADTPVLKQVLLARATFFCPRCQR